jgi:ComF family protein
MRLLHRILDLLLPASCCYCNEPLRDPPVPCFCGSCWADLAPLIGPACPRCGSPFPSPESLSASPDHECGSCRNDPPVFDQAVAAGLFEGQLREAIHRYKYGPLRALGRPLAGWMCGRIGLSGRIDAVMPVPLHRSRLRQRGFNQALLLARGVSERFGLALRYDELLRVRPTRPQVELAGRERSANVQGAFALRDPGVVTGLHILLVDDVLTTGATMNECSRVLKDAGAAAVTALTLARTVE